MKNILWLMLAVILSGCTYAHDNKFKAPVFRENPDALGQFRLEELTLDSLYQLRSCEWVARVLDNKGMGYIVVDGGWLGSYQVYSIYENHLELDGLKREGNGWIEDVKKWPPEGIKEDKLRRNAACGTH
jgi:Tfp pilus assembly protein PilP